MKVPRILLFELNEVPFRVLEDYAKLNCNSAIARLLRSSCQIETHSNDAILSPWVTWPSVHRGVSDDLHNIHYFGQDLTAANAKYPPIWSILAKSNVRVGVFGSLHSFPMPADLSGYSFYMPDTFAADSSAFPPSLSVFQEFNLSMARESARNVSRQVPYLGAYSLLKSARSLGLRASTFVDVAGQLLDERIRPWRRVRRRTYQAVLAFDVFIREFALKRPQFATFFTNHVASSMHRYWAARYPDDYGKGQLEFGDEWRERYRLEIDFSLLKLDASLRTLLDYLEREKEVVLIVASSMGQAAASGRPIKNQLYLTNLSQFMHVLGVDNTNWYRRPAMAPEVSVYVGGDRAESFKRALSGVSINGSKAAFEAREGGFFSISFGQANLSESVTSAQVDGREIAFSDLGLEKVAIEDESSSSAYHIREGSLLVYSSGLVKTPLSGRAKVVTTRIAPTILKMLGLSPPSYMEAPIAELVSLATETVHVN